MIVAVATETGRWPFDLLDVPVWQTMYVYHHLGERDARRAVLDRFARVDAGKMAHLALNDPAKLDDELQSVQQALDALEYETPALDPRRVKAAGLALVARIAAGRVLDDAALTAVFTDGPDGGLVS